MKKSAFLILILAFLNIGCEKEEPVIKKPKLSTLSVIDVTGSTAKSGGYITNPGGADVFSRGVVWSVGQNPTLEDHAGITADGSGIGVFTSKLEDLMYNTKYYVRAYATNSAGTAYGNEISFETPGLPVLSTSPIIDYTSNTAICGGNISFDGGLSVSGRGICWSTSQNPTIDLSTKTTDGAGTGLFTSSITGLTEGTTYYIRAYATNEAGTAYGNELCFNALYKPDLIGLMLNVTSNSNTEFYYSYTIKNIGMIPANMDGPTNEGYDNLSIQKFFSQDTLYSNDDLAAGGSIIGLSPLGFLYPDGTFSDSGIGYFPASFDPDIHTYLLLIIDWGNSIDESNEENNIIYCKVK